MPQTRASNGTVLFIPFPFFFISSDLQRKHLRLVRRMLLLGGRPYATNVLKQVISANYSFANLPKIRTSG
jgi:hypothetical protein